MLSRTLRLWLMISVIVPFVASADQVISDNLIVSGASDGTAPRSEAPRPKTGTLVRPGSVALLRILDRK